MKKLISLLFVAILGVITISSVNAFGTYAKDSHLYINGEKIITGKQIYIDGEMNNIVYFHVRNVLSDGKDEYKYYNYTNGELKEVKEFEDNKRDLSDSENWTISSHYKQDYNLENSRMTMIVDGKEKGPFDCSFKCLHIEDISNNSFYYMYSGYMFTDINTEYTENPSDDYYKLYFYPTTKTEIKSNAKIDKLLNKVFTKIDKKGSDKAQKTYEALIAKLDKLLEKTKSESKKELIEYIKYKVQEKIK